MENKSSKEYAFRGIVINGFLMLFLNIGLTFLSLFLFISGISNLAGDDYTFANSAGMIIASVTLFVASIILWCGFMMQEPNVVRVMMFFGKYVGTFTRTGYFWVNPFITTKRLSMRARNLNIDPIKVNDKEGNPVMIGLVLVWKLYDTYKAMFEIDSQTIAAKSADGSSSMKNFMNALESFVRIQSDAALRQVAGQYSYDNTDGSIDEMTLRGGGDEINNQLVEKLNERLDMAGIEVKEARLNYLAYAPEIAAAMLRRQQATAIIVAREKIVEGAVSMVKMALDKLSSEEIVDLDDDKKAAMVSNLLVVLCGDDNAQPVVNTGTLNT